MADGIGSLSNIVIDVSDLARAEAFWGDLLGVSFGEGLTPAYRAATEPRTGLLLLLQEVPETKVGKNRVHMDVSVPDVEAALERVQALGGSLANWVTDDPIPPYPVCADPDGNEFCLIPI